MNQTLTNKLLEIEIRLALAEDAVDIARKEIKKVGRRVTNLLGGVALWSLVLALESFVDALDNRGKK